MGSSPVESTCEMKIDKIYILALNLTEEKAARIKAKLDRCGFDGSVGYEILDGHDGRKDPLPEGCSVYQGWGLGENTWNKFWKLPVQPGEVGCALSHINAWKRIAAGDEQRVLILEEDFMIEPGKSMLALPEPNENWPFVWDYINLGRWVFNHDHDIILDRTYCIPSLHYNMHAYILTKVGAQKLVDYDLEKNLIINDEFITATYMKHRREDIEAMFPVKTITALATHEMIFEQEDHVSAVSAHTRD